MSSIPATDSRAQNNPYSSAASRTAREEEEEGKTAGTGGSDASSETGAPELTEEERKALVDYKREFLAKVKVMMAKPHLSNVGIELDISDAGFQKMMKDSGYEKSVLDTLTAKTAHSYTRMSGTIKLSANGESDPSAVLAESKSVSEILFSTSNRPLLRTLGIDSMIAVADDAIAGFKGGERSRFDLAARLGSAQMRSTNSYLESYLKNLNSVDTTG